MRQDWLVGGLVALLGLRVGWSGGRLVNRQEAISQPMGRLVGWLAYSMGRLAGRLDKRMKRAVGGMAGSVRPVEYAVWMMPTRMMR